VEVLLPAGHLQSIIIHFRSYAFETPLADDRSVGCR
jgi:hypothetical protein